MSAVHTEDLTETQHSRQQRMMQTTCVLLIEDDELARARLEAVIERAGYGVFSAANAAEARQALGLVIFPIVIIDRVLPDADGIQLCREVRALSAPNRIFAMLLSARDSAEDIAAGIAAGADDYLSKKAADADLLERIRLAIRKIRMAMK
jgi:DNA-binding response OmpR family regulator